MHTISIRVWGRNGRETVSRVRACVTIVIGIVALVIIKRRRATRIDGEVHKAIGVVIHSISALRERRAHATATDATARAVDGVVLCHRAIAIPLLKIATRDAGAWKAGIRVQVTSTGANERAIRHFAIHGRDIPAIGVGAGTRWRALRNNTVAILINRVAADLSRSRVDRSILIIAIDRAARNRTAFRIGRARDGRVPIAISIRALRRQTAVPIALAETTNRTLTIAIRARRTQATLRICGHTLILHTAVLLTRRLDAVQDTAITVLDTGVAVRESLDAHTTLAYVNSAGSLDAVQDTAIAVSGARGLRRSTT